VAETPLNPERDAELRKQLDIKTRLETKWLERMEAMLDAKEITSTDMATLARVLMQNGWTIDADKLPQELRSKLTSVVSFEEGDEEPKIRMIR
jgi:hypothetical protein